MVKDTLDPCMQTALLLAVYCYALSSSFGIPYPKSIVQYLAILACTYVGMAGVVGYDLSIDQTTSLHGNKLHTHVY